MFKKHPTLISGLAITVLFLILSYAHIGLLDTLNLKLYDLMMRLRTDAAGASDIVIVDIDDDSIDKLGRWPWRRSLLADGIAKISAGSPKAIGLNLILSEAESSAGLEAVKAIEKLFSEQLLADTSEKGQAFLAAIAQTREKLDNDRILADALKNSGKVVLPGFFKTTGMGVSESSPVDNTVKGFALKQTSNPQGLSLPVADAVTLPLALFTANAAGLGHINLAFDPDGTARREPLLYEYRGLLFPSYTLRLSALFLGVPLDKIQATVGEQIRCGPVDVPLTIHSNLLVNFKGPRGSFKSYSYFDVINDKIPLAVFKNKLVLVSASAAGIMNPLSTSTDATMPLGEFTANTLWSILNRQFIRQPLWAAGFELLLVLVIGALITVVLPRLRAMLAGIVFWAMVVVLAGGSIFMFASQGLWVQITYPLIQLILGYIAVLSIKYFVTEVGKEKVEGESAETNRQLGLTYQQQGMLDMAFDKFRRVPVDDQLKDILYNLALDYERKRQFNKAASVFEYIEEHDAGFKDVGSRKSKLMQASETMIFGDGLLGGGGGADKMLATGTGTRPTLGRYEVIKQLGKGAMGVVYLGQDPRINRTCAIKTFRFPEDIDQEELAKLKERFFREAESAGTLSHPHIVTIYDAGDEQDLAYIAMEFLEGDDLDKYVKKDKLLPMRKVIEYVADIADALDYAHQKGIVHRDIKPANIMLLKSGMAKITDFGIARITATSQTQTGVVKGTPFYMSPEQFSGEKVDGRSDIFSLGTTMYQLLTGVLPFHGENPAALMNQILNVPHPDPRQFNPKIVKPLVLILNKAMEKDRDKRYQRAMQLATHLRQLGQKIDMAVAGHKPSA